MGFKTLNEMIGRTDLKQQDKLKNWKAYHLDLSPILYGQTYDKYNKEEQNHVIDKTLGIIRNFYV